MTAGRRTALAVAAALLAMAASAAAGPGSLYTTVREKVDNPERSSSAVSHLENLLGEIEDRVVAESNNTELQWKVTEAQYLHDMTHINDTLIVAEAKRAVMDARLLNMTKRLNVVKGDLDSLDSRIQVRSKRVDEIEVLVTDGNTFDTKREVRFQDRTAYAKKTVEGVDNVIDALGSNSVDEVEGSLRQALNSDHAGYSEEAPNVADVNKTAGAGAGAAKPPAAAPPAAKPAPDAEKEEEAENAAAPGKTGSFVEAEAKVGDDLDELRLLLGQLHSEMHKYMDDMATVRVKQGGDWAHQVGKYGDETKKLKAEVDALEATRKPNEAEVNALKESYANVSLARIEVTNAVTAAKTRLESKSRALQLLRAEHTSEQSARESQVTTVERLQRSLEQHDGETPHHVRNAAREAGVSGSAEEQRLKRIKAALLSKPQTSANAPSSPSTGNATGAPEKREKATARPRS